VRQISGRKKGETSLASLLRRRGKKGGIVRMNGREGFYLRPLPPTRRDGPREISWGREKDIAFLTHSARGGKNARSREEKKLSRIPGFKTGGRGGKESALVRG